MHESYIREPVSCSDINMVMVAATKRHRKGEYVTKVRVSFRYNIIKEPLFHSRESPCVKC
jgi:hypothetical protein